MGEYEPDQEVLTEYGQQWPHVDPPSSIGHIATDIEAAVFDPEDASARHFVSPDGSSYTVRGEPPLMQPLNLYTNTEE